MITSLVLGALGTIFVILVGFADGDEELTSAVDNGLVVTGIVLGVAVLGALASFVNGLVVNPKGIKNALIGIAALALVVLVAWLMADPSAYAKYDLEGGMATFVAVGLNMFFITALLTLLTVVYSGVARILK